MPEKFPQVREHYVEEHARVLEVIEPDGTATYSIDTWALLEGEPEGMECIESKRSGAKLCYKDLGRCTGVILVTPGRVELINLRLKADPGLDPAVAKRECEEVAKEVLQPVEWG
ncbi:MAG: hypothetical protein F7C35_08425 [Desulfurococcales archaeon]|nr:hypothetical protein [Desulfurococcales archaeon]